MSQKLANFQVSLQYNHRNLVSFYSEVPGSFFALKGIVDILEWVFSFAAGSCYWFLVASMVYSAVSSQWLNLGIMGGLFICLVVLTLLVGFIGSTIEICRDNVRGLYI